MSHGRKLSIVRPIENIREYCKDKEARSEAGWVKGKVVYRGKKYSPKAFDKKFPAELKYRVQQLDGTQVRTN